MNENVQGIIEIMSKHYSRLDDLKGSIKYIEKIKKIDSKNTIKYEEEINNLQSKMQKVEAHIEDCLSALKAN